MYNRQLIHHCWSPFLWPKEGWKLKSSLLSCTSTVRHLHDGNLPCSIIATMLTWTNTQNHALYMHCTCILLNSKIQKKISQRKTHCKTQKNTKSKLIQEFSIAKVESGLCGLVKEPDSCRKGFRFLHLLPDSSSKKKAWSVCWGSLMINASFLRQLLM